jgi:hypothetical protein
LVAEVLRSVLGTYSSRVGPDVVTLMEHYQNLLRRYIMPDSDIADLCRKIYTKHRQALDLIFEHRPDAQLRVAEVIQGLINDTPEIVPDTMGKSYMHFALREWDEQSWQHLGKGWTRSGRLLLFEFQNYSEKSRSLVLYIGPGDDDARSVLFEAFCEPTPRFKGAVSEITKAYTRVYTKKWPAISSAVDMDDEELQVALEKPWREFVQKDLPRIREIAAGINWTAGS